MDAKDLRTESAVSERNNDGSKYTQSGGIALHCDRNKSYQDMGSNSLGKVDVPNARPCAVIGPDRVVPPPAASEAYHIKKIPAEPWPCMDNAYRRPPEYPHKLTNLQNPTRNISPRQTFQENMQRIMVPPTYNSVKINDDTNYAQMSDRSNGLSKNIKLNMPPEAKFCDVPYAVNPNNNEQKNVRNPEMCLPSVNPTLTRTAPHGWPPGSVNLRSSRMYGAPELYQYQEYPSCAGPRPVVPRPHRTVPDEQAYVYSDSYYQDGNIRFKPYPSVKERYPHQRYEYIGNYSNPFHPPGFSPHKYELQKSMQPHPYPPYPPIKYLDTRAAEPVMEGFHRNPQPNYKIQYCNQVIHPNYGPVLGNCPQNKLHSYPPDAHLKTIPPNKLPYDNNNKAYIEYENNRPKLYPTPESYFVNEMTRMPMKSQVIMPNYPTLNMHNIPPNTYYKKDHQQMKNYDHMAHFRNIDPNLNVHNPMSRHAPVFSPNTLAISPTDSNTSNDTTQTLGTSQEDCGYVSQSSNASVRSMDSGINRIPNEYLRKYYDNRYGPIVRTSPMLSKPQLNSNNNQSKDKKQIDVRQFLQMWNEGDEEAEENSSKEIIIQTGSSDKSNFGKTHEAMNNQEQLYVLGLVNVPSEELAKYEHIQKVSKLPENIKGYNSIELLNQFEEVLESSNMNNYKTSTLKEYQMSMKVIPKQAMGIIPPRPVSPLDVEAKISQSVIHKEVGCNFEIKPCSPKMLNVEVAAPIQNILAERSIEKVANPIMIKSPMLNGIDENIDCNLMKRSDHRLNMNENVRIPSCKMINTQFSNDNPIEPIKSSYSLQDLESNSGLCLASLPRLDNDIELNFPEVNQQFINANKGDSSVITNSLRDLPTLDLLDQSNNRNKDKFDMNSSRIDNDINKSPYVVESEKEFSKLSKYRKTKSSSSEVKENQTLHNVNATRTDSVIIKNPENVKNYEECSDFASNNLCKEISDIQQVPINLTSQGNLSSNDGNEPLNDLYDEDRKKPVGIAIDFSLHKSGVLDKPECKTKMVSPNEATMHVEENAETKMDSQNETTTTHGEESPETKMDSQNETTMHVEENPGTKIDSQNETMMYVEENPEIKIDSQNENTMHVEKNPDTEIDSQNESTMHVEEYHSNVLVNKTDDSVISPKNEDFISMGITAENCSPFCKIDTECNPESKNQAYDFTMNDDESDLKELPSSNEQYTETSNELIKSASQINVVENMTFDDTYNSQLVNISTEIPNNEMLTSIKSNNKVSKEFDKCKEVISDESSEVDNIITGPNLDNPEILMNDVDDKTYETATDTNCTKIATVADFCESDNLIYKLKSSENFENKMENGTSELDNPNKIDDLEITKHTTPQNMDYNHSLLTNEKMYFNNNENNSDLIQSHDAQKLESHQISNKSKIDKINYEIEVDSTTQILEELSDHERELKDFEEKYCEDTQIFTPKKSNECYQENDSLKSVIKDPEMQVKGCLGYGSKEMYSPWIQKLLLFIEGPIINIITKADSNESDNLFCGPAETETNIITKHNICDNDYCVLDTTEVVPFGQVSSIDVSENSERKSIDEINNEIIDNNVSDVPILDENMVETENDIFDDEDCSEVELNNIENDNNEPKIVIIDNITAASNPVDVESIKEDVIVPTLESEPNVNENTDNSETSVECVVNLIDNHFNNDECDLPDTSSNLEDNYSEPFQEVSRNCDRREEYEKPERDLSTPFENIRFSCNRMQEKEFIHKKLQPLKRSLSDSALNIYSNDDRLTKQENEQNVPFNWSSKRRKVNNVVDKDLLAQNLCNIIHNNRRNSISTIYTEENVSFCILIDNNCIITEEENEEPEKLCYTELSEDCIAEIQNNCIKLNENTDILTEDISSHDNPCDYSDSFVMECEEKTLEESWVEDVACVETVISDDIAEDIEICGPSFHKDDVLSDNDESGVFSSSEHTDKVKYIYGDKMCSDDALFVETLYKTPQMDVNKTLYNRETHVSEEYQRYYDNDSLEKMLSESNEQELSPYVPEYMDSIFSPEVVSSKETPENKENMNIDTFPSFHSKENALDIAVDVDKIEHKNVPSDIFVETRDDTVHSCESSVDNVFTYNQKDEDAIYTSSSPEVSSTTSEEKSSGILLKITNYKGSRISQINDISRVNKTSGCKFTEDREYAHSSFPTTRPLLTKAAQKYIPPLKESIRDLKVKLSLPQHSLMKLKQLKISKDEPKVNKQNGTPSRIPKKPKPKFEDVLKSIDEIQFKMHKEKNKKTKKTIPKVVIKKNQNGSHYASTSNKDDFNPDMTGRKWQPWVFIEKSHFIDKMAIKKKTKAVYSHRKQTYVLAEKFQKYKSVSNSSAKFVISPPISDNPSKGLKYTIRLKHNY